MTARLFVYGTLLPGEAGHDLLAGSLRVGEAATAPSFTLVDLGPYPALVRGGATSVRGEVWEIDDATLAALDRFEGHPELYERATLALPGHGEVQAYFAASTLAAGRPVIASGAWRER